MRTVTRKNAFYAQSGGVTAVINASACGVIETARAQQARSARYSPGATASSGPSRKTSSTPRASAVGDSRTHADPGGGLRLLPPQAQVPGRQPRRVRAPDRGFPRPRHRYFFYNGGGDSADTCLKVSQLSDAMGYPLQAIHVPKTIDNDLPLTDNCPGFGSVAKYVAISTREAAWTSPPCAPAPPRSSSWRSWDVTPAGSPRRRAWRRRGGRCAALILFPEIAFNEKKFLARVKRCVQALRLLRDRRLRRARRPPTASSSAMRAPATPSATRSSAAWLRLWRMIKDERATSTTGPWPTTCSARHDTSPRRPMSSRPTPSARPPWRWPSPARMPSCPASCAARAKRYRWSIGEAPLADVANVEKMMPRTLSAATVSGSRRRPGTIWRP
jgi:hypothetical protein